MPLLETDLLPCICVQFSLSLASEDAIKILFSQVSELRTFHPHLFSVVKISICSTVRLICCLFAFEFESPHFLVDANCLFNFGACDTLRLFRESGLCKSVYSEKSFLPHPFTPFPLATFSHSFPTLPCR